MFVAPPHWLSTAVIVVPVVAGAAFGLRAARRIPGLDLVNALRRVPLLWACLGVALLPPLLMGLLLWRDRIALQLPLAVQYWGPIVVLSLFVASFAFLYAFAAGLAHGGNHPERGKLAIVALIVTGGLAHVQFAYPRPIAADLVHETAADGSILQSSDSSCAAASGANVARALGVEVREAEVAAAMNTTRLAGTSLPQMIVGMRRFGIDCATAISEAANPADLSTPALLMVDHPAIGRESHVVALMRRTGERFEVIDPLDGRERWTAESLRGVWHGLALTCRRMADSASG